MIEITIRLKPGRAAAFGHLLRALADLESDRGQAKAYRGAARRAEHLARTKPAVRPAPRPVAEPTGPRPFRYRPQVHRPKHPGIDERAVQRVVLGIRPFPVLSREEARLACWHLTTGGCSAPEIAQRLGVAQRTINRWRAEDRQAVAA